MPELTQIGILSFAHLHAASYASALVRRADAELAFIWDDDPERGQAMATQYQTRFVADLDAALAQRTDGLIVTSENIRHRFLVEKAVNAAEKAAAILCEKPLATTKGDGEAMIAAAQNAGVRLYTAFPCRYSPAFRRAANSVRSGRLGKILAIRGANRGVCPMSWFVDPAKSGGGAIIDHTVHVADLNRVLLGQEVVQVQAEASRNMYRQAWEDCGFVSLTYADGTFATIDSSWSRPPKSFKTWGDVTLEILAESGVVELDLFGQGYLYFDEATSRTNLVGWGSNIDAGMIGDFVRAARGDDPEFLATGVDGLRASEVAFAAYESLRAGQPVTMG